MKLEQHATSRRPPAVIAFALLAVVACALPAIAGKRDADVIVESNPPGALVSVHTSVDTEIDSAKTAEVDVVVEIAIVRFEANIPHPASNPYTATMVYKITVKDTDETTILVQTVTGDGQTSKGMMSGFKAKQLAAESAVRAMNDAARQAFEALAEAPELAEIHND